MAKRPVHVVPHEGEWATRREGASRVSDTFSTQEKAAEAGREAARRDQTEVLIHGRDGRIRERESYGNDPCPPRDREH
ncbi:MAG: DUF2188 domain-containing protein [Deltaproteobacteria bacterium]|nr:DUF2188 domain-containing protein [Deltaproteobacteria bacterium]